MVLIKVKTIAKSRDRGTPLTKGELSSLLPLNALSASKLSKSVLLWGQPFDGSKDVDGVLNVTGSTGYAEGIRLHPVSGISSVWFGASGLSGYDAGMFGLTKSSAGLRFRGPLTEDATVPTDFLTICLGGNVGIGTSTPAYKLDVAGEAHVSSLVIGGIRIVADGDGLRVVDGGLYADTYLSALGKNSSSAGNVSGMGDLTDVELTGLQAGELLQYDGSRWKNVALSTGLDEGALGVYLSSHGYVTDGDVTLRLSGYLPLSGGTLTGDLSLNRYLKINAWTGYGTGSASLWYDGSTETVVLDKKISASGFVGNASSASKLSKSVLLWGQPFDGSKDVDGYLSTKDGILVTASDNYSAWARGFIFTAGGTWKGGLYGSGNDGTVYSLNLCVGDYNSKNGLFVNNNGNVGIGTLTPAYKLDVAGEAHVSSLVIGGIRIVADGDGLRVVDGGLYADTYLSALGKNSSSAGNVSGMGDLTDVELTGLQAGELLQYDGSRWKNVALSTGLDEGALGVYLSSHGYVTDGDVTLRLSGYLPLSGGTLTGDLSLNRYLKINAWTGYGTGSASLWYDGSTETVVLDKKISASGFVGNASSASKLSKSVLLWGQPFDGSKDVDGYLSTKDGILVTASDNYSAWARGFIFTAGGTWKGGLYGSGNDGTVYSLNLCVGDYNSKNGLFVNNNGNVGIGTLTPAYKLDVAGEAHVSSLVIGGIRIVADGDGLRVVDGGLYADTYLSALGKNSSSAGNVSGMGDLTDVELTGLQAGELLQYDGSRWKNVALSTGLDEGALGVYLSSHGYVTDGDVTLRLSGYLPLSGGTLTGDLSLNRYLKINAWTGYGTGSASLWYNGTTETVALDKKISAAGFIGNASTASKLSKGVNIWGQPFDGSKDVDGVLNVTGTTDYAEGIRLHPVSGISSVWFGASGNSGYDAGMFGITKSSAGLRFRGPSSDDASVPSDYVTMAVGGNVGIGTSTPSCRLDVQGSSKIAGVLNVTGVLNYAEGIRLHPVSGISSIWFGASGETGYDAGMFGITKSSVGLRFRGPASDNTTAPSDYMTLAVGGNVGIGTSSPVYKLDVNGAARVSSLRIGEIAITYDSTNKALSVSGGLYTATFLSALGVGQTGGGGGADLSTVWASLSSSDSNRQIDKSHLTNALADYAQLSSLSGLLTQSSASVQFVSEVSLYGDGLRVKKNDQYTTLTLPYADRSGESDRLSVKNKTVWGQKYWSDTGVPMTVYGTMSDVENINLDENAVISGDGLRIDGGDGHLLLGNGGDILVYSNLYDRAGAWRLDGNGDASFSGEVSTRALKVAEEALMSGGLIIPSGSYVRGRSTGGYLIDIAGLDSDDCVLLGSENYVTNLFGDSILFNVVGMSGPALEVTQGTLTSYVDIETTSYVQIGRARLVYDSVNQALKLQNPSGGSMNFYTTGGISSLGLSGSLSGEISQSLYPSRTNSYSLGRNSNRWKEVYAGKLDVNGQVTVGQLYIGSSSAGMRRNTDDQLELYSSSGLYIPDDVTIDGYVLMNGGYSSSDVRMKRILSYPELSAECVARAPLIRFQYEGSDPRIHLGSTAQYWAGVTPESVMTTKKGFLALDYATTALVSVISTARELLRTEERIMKLEKEVEELKTSKK